MLEKVTGRKYIKVKYQGNVMVNWSIQQLFVLEGLGTTDFKSGKTRAAVTHPGCFSSVVKQRPFCTKFFSEHQFSSVEVTLTVNSILAGKTL